MHNHCTISVNNTKYALYECKLLSLIILRYIGIRSNTLLSVYYESDITKSEWHRRVLIIPGYYSIHTF